MATMTEQQSTTTTTTLSKESRAALRKALREQLETVRKKVRHMRAKGLTTGGAGGGDKPDVKDGHKTASVAREQADRDRSDVRGKSGGNLDEKKQKGFPTTVPPADAGEEGLKDEAEEFFARGVRPKVGKTKSVVARIMSSEQRSFAQDHRKPPPASPQKKGRKK
jgi:hypothetical protein